MSDLRLNGSTLKIGNGNYRPVVRLQEWSKGKWRNREIVCMGIYTHVARSISTASRGPCALEVGRDLAKLCDA